jgi:hypothetical protein
MTLVVLDHSRSTQFSLAAVNGTSVQSLLWTAKTDKVLDHGGDVLALQTLDVAITDFARKVRIFRESFLDL